MDCFVAEAAAHSHEPWFQRNLDMFLQVCHAHGQTALQHHEQLVNKFIEKPADDAALSNTEGLTASGPPLPVLLKSLRKLCDMRRAADVQGAFRTRYHDVEMLRGCLS